MAVEGVIVTKIGSYQSSLKYTEDVYKALGTSEPAVSGNLMKLKVLSCGLCFPDVLTIEGKHVMKRTAPYVPCNEIAGEVVQVGPDVTRFKVGDKVFGTTVTGGLMSYTLTSEDNCYKIPEGVDPNVVAGLEVNYGTTYHALVDLAKIKSGETLLVLGASGGVGMSAIDLGKALGCRVVACASTAEKLEECKKAGADILINYETDGGGDFKTALKDAGVYGEIDVVYDPVGGKFSDPALRATAWGGRFLVIGFASGGTNPNSAIPSIPINLTLVAERHIIGCLWGMWKTRDGNAINRKNMDHMVQMIQEGKLKPVVSQTYTLNDYQLAFDAMMGRKAVSKITIKPSFSKAAKL